jgi:hypothetical protein
MNKTCLLIVSVLSLNLLAGSFELATPAYNGSGCEVGTIRLAITPERNEVFLETPNYISSADARKTCMLALPIQASPGTKVAISSIYFKSDAHLEYGDTAVFQAELFLAGLKSPTLIFQVEGSLNKTQVSFLAPTESELIWSGCGQSANLRVNTNLLSTGGTFKILSLGARLKTKPC